MNPSMIDQDNPMNPSWKVLMKSDGNSRIFGSKFPRKPLSFPRVGSDPMAYNLPVAYVKPPLNGRGRFFSIAIDLHVELRVSWLRSIKKVGSFGGGFGVVMVDGWWCILDGRNPKQPPGMFKPCQYWYKLPINWCRISSIDSIVWKLLLCNHVFGIYNYGGWCFSPRHDRLKKTWRIWRLLMRTMSFIKQTATSCCFPLIKMCMLCFSIGYLCVFTCFCWKILRFGIVLLMFLGPVTEVEVSWRDVSEIIRRYFLATMGEPGKVENHGQITWNPGFCGSCWWKYWSAPPPKLT